ncbi:hypothetical protein QYE76_009970 [Lolium multiflorum]|uniref:RING-type domain-containing protein n=1 Tax=Lolium multiflorum TaxID=4521 RepID=A0AAD8X1F7_LOLMU|nr:hypothetical protein QYE76_009970 [Lolium multiflorum]
MAVETRIRAGAPTRFNKFDGECGGVSSVHLRCTVTFEHASRRLRGGGAAVPDRVKPELQQLPWTSDEVRPLRDPSILLRPDDTLRAVRDMLAAMPRLRGVDLSPANWDGEHTPRVVAAWLQEQGSRWLSGARRPCRFEVEARLQVKQVFHEPRAVLQRCLEVAMQTVAPGSDEECGICLDEFRNGGKSGPVNLPCSHAFHRHCMLTWLDRGTNCPSCRYDLTGMVAAPWTSRTSNDTTTARTRRRWRG